MHNIVIHTYCTVIAIGMKKRYRQERYVFISNVVNINAVIFKVYTVPRSYSNNTASKRAMETHLMIDYPGYTGDK